MDRAIEINHLSVVFHTESGQVHAVKDVSLTLKHGVITGLIGETGSGKSVMASAILRMLPFYAEVSGSIRYQGMEILEADHRTVRDLRRNHIGLIPQNPSESLNPARRILPQTAECFEGSRRERRNITYHNMEKMGLTEQEMIKIIRNGFAYGIDGKKYLPMFDAWVKDFYERPENKECEE